MREPLWFGWFSFCSFGGLFGQFFVFLFGCLFFVRGDGGVRDGQGWFGSGCSSQLL